MAQRRLEGLQRVLGVYPLASSAYGNVGSSIYYALGLVASLALGLTPLVFIISGFIFFLTASTYAEATAMFPEAGGSSSFARHAFNEFWSFFAAWGQMLNYMLTVATSAFFVPHYIGGLFWSALGHPPGDVVAGIVVIVVLAAINIRGVQESAGVNLVLAVIDFCTQVLIVLVGLVLVFSPSTLVGNVHLGVAPSWGNFLIAIPLCMLAYTGIETISNMSEEAKDPGRTVPRAINRVVIAVFAIYALLPAIALSALPVHCVAGHCQTLLGLDQQHGGYAGDPVLGVVRALHLGPLQHAAEIYVGLLAATILFIGTNAGILGVSRLTYSMGIHRQVPDRLRQLHPRYRTPWVGIVLFSFIAALTLIPGQATFLGNLYAFGAMLSFTIAHVAVTRMRVSIPEANRPYRPPGNWRVRGLDLPLFAIVGAFCTFASLCVLAALHTSVAIAGIGWLAVGMIIYPLYRHRHGLDLTTTTKVAIARPAVETEAEYDSVLVAFDEHSGYTPEVMATAARMAARRRRGIHVLVTIAVPATSPISAALPAQEAAAQSIIEEAKVQEGRRVSGHWEKVRAGQTGRRIVDQAKAMRAAAIVMPMPQDGAGFGRALATVLRERPCRVIVESIPSADRRRPSVVA
ncbi:MAG: APC family permease [Solirubrobacterales bacterium]|nr:APC family permease [Solirubrobacterales bacterium]MBV9364464.1 APC family permease [Solirubrobacterales bacterium]MBV9806672.1 APC family permease [Solirubrobacterales bacterium]